MSDIAIWLVEHGIKSSTLAPLLVTIAAFYSFFSMFFMIDLSEKFKSSKNYSVFFVLTSFVVLAPTLSILKYTSYISGRDLINGVLVQISTNNEYIINYKTTGKIAKGYDLNGNLIYSIGQYKIERTIICQKDYNIIGYNECWKLIKSKSRDELISMSHPLINKNNIITMSK